jgi:hypothetical protein
MNKLKSVLPHLLILIVAIIIVVKLFPIAHPNGGIKLPLDSRAIADRAKAVLDSLKIDASYLSPSTTFQIDKKLLRQVQQENGIARSNDMIRNNLPVYYWETSWKKKQLHILGLVNTEQENKSDFSKLSAFLKGDINLHLAPGGGVISFMREFPDSENIPTLDSSAARAMAEKFLIAFSGYISAPGIRDSSQSVKDAAAVPYVKFVNEQAIRLKTRTDREYQWFTVSPQLHDTINIKTRIAGNILSSYSVSYNIPEKYAEKESLDFQIAAVIIIFVVLIIFLLVLGFKRMRAYEIGFKTALAAGIVVAIASCLEIFMMDTKLSGWEFLIPLLLNPILFGGAFIILWAIVEAAIRDVWSEKFISIDLLRNGHFFHSRIGSNIIKGISVGVGALALWLVLAWLGNMITLLASESSMESATQIFYTKNPAIYLLAYSLYAGLYFCVFFILFTVTLFRTWIKNAAIVLLLSAVVVGMTNFEGIVPQYYGIIITAIVSLLFAWSFFRCDALVALTALFTWSAAKLVASLLSSGSPEFVVSGWLAIGFFGLLLVYSLAALFRKREITDFTEIAPAFARHISERQRLQQEIEIARQVQMSLLPKTNPHLGTLTISSCCVPAKEVGGDYYDFIRLDDDKLGVALGDVSGKGTQAAFFMTLTKGFLRALVKYSDSPADVLTQVNKLFYENVERGVFISMLYAVFDVKNNRVSVARAGQNPVIAYKAKSRQIPPTGSKM